MKPSTPLEQIIGDVRAAIKAIGKHGKVVLVVLAPDDDGTIMHRVERSVMVQEDWEKLMRTPPEAGRVEHLKKGRR